MVEFHRLAETAARLIVCLRDEGITGLDDTLTALRTTSMTYRYTYDRYVEYFKSKQSGALTELDLFVGFAFAYSWMSSIKQLDPSLGTVELAVAALNKLHALQASDLSLSDDTAGSADTAALDRLAGSVEPIRYFLGSVIGTSKMLHFVNPEVFPIWDAVVHRYCSLPEHAGAADSLRTYAQYTYMIHHLLNHPDYEARVYRPLLQAMEQAHKAISDQYRTPEPMGKVRAAEFIMFYGGKAEHAA
jgi:hypothetical protein